MHCGISKGQSACQFPGRKRRKALSEQRRPSCARGCRRNGEKWNDCALFRRCRREPFTSLAGFRFWLWLGRLLDFLFAFILVSHGSKFDTKGARGESPGANRNSPALGSIVQNSFFLSEKLLALRVCVKSRIENAEGHPIRVASAEYGAASMRGLSGASAEDC